MSSIRKTRLLSSAALGAGLLLSAQQASAQCATTTTVNPSDSTSCGTTVTTNTTGNGPTDRNQQYGTGTIPVFLNINGAISGFGLAYSPVVSGANLLTVTNNGSVQVDAGNLASAGGAAALNINAAGATPVSYLGTGSVTNLGTEATASTSRWAAPAI